MTDKEIIQALECCGKNPPVCSECHYRGRCNKIDCYDYLKRDALDIINRKQAEIERLKERDETAEKIIREQGGTILDLKHKNIRLFDRNSELSEKGEKAIIACIAARNEAVREFAERLKEKAYTQPIFDTYCGNKYMGDVSKVYVAEIDNLVKEMVGDAE